MIRQQLRAGSTDRRLVIGARLAFVVVMLVLWQLADRRLLPDFVISSPYEVAIRLKLMAVSPTMWSNIAITLEELALGYGIGVVLGLIAGIGLGASRTLGMILEPIIYAVNSIPHIALAPLFLIVFGLGIWSKVSVAALIVAFVMFNNTFTGMRALPTVLMQNVLIMGASKLATIRWVVVPAISVPIMSGLRACAPFSMIGVVVGEFIAADAGVGYYIRNATENFDAAGLWAGLVLLVAIVMLLSFMLGRLEGAVLRWRE